MPPRKTAVRPAAKAICAIFGLDTFLAERALTQALTRHLGAERGEAVEVLRGDEVSWTRVLETFRTPSLFSPRRAVVVRGAEQLKEGEEGIGAGLADPPPGTLLVLQAAKPDRRTTVWKRVMEMADVVSAEPLKGRALREYVLREIAERRLAIPEEGLAELLERVGQDLRRLMSELDKLEAFGAGRGALTAEEVAAVLGRGLARPLYRLADAFAERDVALTLELIEECLEEGEAGLRILGALHRTLRHLRGAQAVAGTRVASEALRSRLGVLPFKVQALLDASRRWSEADLSRAQAALKQADGRLKASADARVALTVVVALTAKATPRGPQPPRRR
jgi:DNA polymerase-3 subunit delta